VDEAEIQFQRVRHRVRFNRTDLLEWATARRLPIALDEFDSGLDPEENDGFVSYFSELRFGRRSLLDGCSRPRSSTGH
jgi:hypothetical protein